MREPAGVRGDRQTPQCIEHPILFHHQHDGQVRRYQEEEDRGRWRCQEEVTGGWEYMQGQWIQRSRRCQEEEGAQEGEFEHIHPWTNAKKNVLRTFLGLEDVVFLVCLNESSGEMMWGKRVFNIRSALFIT